MKKIFVFGNPYLKEDSLAVKVAKQLSSKEFEVILCSNPDDLLNHELDNSIILDVAKGIEKVELFDDIDSLEFSVIFSAHDFDLGFFLKLMKETGKLEKINIIGVPQGYDENRAANEMHKLINKK
ncbi:MAG TPA: hypothetical protein VJ461_03790 [Candidatus Nanoarchaeia archaeon]|nr:hypothetical protein [Candidatus Nanoarchaeia archaeon]